jgi:serine/threonine protein kinase
MEKVLVKKYKLLEPLASGGMATVYLAKNLATDEIVVAKIPNFMGLPNKEKLEKRFMREAQILSKINSKYVVKIHDFGQEETGEYFLILEYLHGKTLEEMANSKDRIPVPTVVDITMQMAEVLRDLHEQGIVHRDIKSSNIKITSEGNIKLFDFGISKGDDLPSMTHSTDFLGTLQYMSPEQTDGREVDIRSDIYSLGIVIYEMLFGKLPFDAPSPVEVLEMQRNKQPKVPPEAREREISISIITLMLRCLEKRPDDRFQNPAELLNALKVVTEEIGISQVERDKLRQTTFTQILSRTSVPTYKARQKKRRLAVILSASLAVLAITAGFFFGKGCFVPPEVHFKIAQGEQLEYILPIQSPPGVTEIKATITETPKYLVCQLEKSDNSEQEQSNLTNNSWIMKMFAFMTAELGIYPVKLKVNYILEGNLSSEEEIFLNIEIIKGEIGTKALKLVDRSMISDDPNAKVDKAVEINGKVYIPVDPIANSTNASTEWDKNAGKLTYITSDKTIELTKGENVVKENGQTKTITDAPVVINDSMLISDKTAQEAMNTEVKVDKKSGDVTLTYKEAKPGSKVIFNTVNDKNENVSGATVMIGGVYKGKTPLTLELQTGTYKVTITMQGFVTITDEIALKTIKNTSQDYTLVKDEQEKPPGENTAKTGTLYLSVNVPWGTFFVNGDSYPNRMSMTLELPAGKYDIVYKLAGIADQKATVYITNGKEYSKRFNINSARLTVKTNVAGAVVQFLNVTFERILTSKDNPWSMEIAAQKYTIYVSKTINNKNVSTKKVVDLKPGENRTEYFELKP